MSNYRAVAAATATLQAILQDAVRVIPGATVKSGRPDKDAAAQSPAGLVNIFLYQAHESASWRNAELPVRRSDGTLIRRPQLALDLHYLFSFYGDDSRQIPHLLLGLVALALHTEPTPNPAFIPRPSPDAADESLDLGRSGLREQAHLLRFVPLSMTHDELSKLWSIFFQVPYTLSIAYRCSVILMEPDLTPQPALPVRGPMIHMRLPRLPQVDEVTPQVLTSAPGTVLTLKGRRLEAKEIRIAFGAVETKPLSMTDTAIQVALPAGLAAGINTVRVVHGAVTGSPPRLRWVFSSDPVPFALLPRITAPPEIGLLSLAPGPRREPQLEPTLTLHVDPEVGAQQQVAVLLNQIGVPAGEAPAAFTFAGAPREAKTGVVHAAVAGSRPGHYLVRVQVDGVASPLEVDPDPESPTFNQYTGPAVDVE